MLNRWRAESQRRTLYVLDVRDPAEYEAGHVAGAISAPGGQLVQATDQYVRTLGARLVLVDDSEVRAVMTASWRSSDGMEGCLCAGAGRHRRKGWPAFPIFGTPPRPESAIDSAALLEEIAKKA